MTIITNSLDQARESNDQHALYHFSKALGKTRPCRLRAVKKGRGAKLIGDDLSRAEKLNSQGYDIYSVINDGGDKDADITRCPALFVEFDDKPKDFQLNFWKSYGLPEPTLVVDSGNKSLHTYWALTEPIHPETWSTLQRGLVEWVGSDPACVNPSRCMRVPGFIHQKTGKRSQIVSRSSKQHKPDTFQNLIPENHLKASATKPEGFGQWSDAIPCPICGRDDVDCRIHESGNIIQCHHGQRFHPPEMSVGATMSGQDQRIWAYVGPGNNAVGPCSNFKIDESMQTQSQDVQKPHSLARRLGKKHKQEWIIEDILAGSSFVLLGAETGAGKSVLLYRMAASIASGENFAGAFSVKRSGKILILQADESEGDLQKKFSRMDLPDSALENMDAHFPEPGFLGREQGKQWLLKLLDKGEYVAVFLDSMTTLFAGNGASTKDAEFALPLYELTAAFDQRGIGCVIADHLRKADAGGRTEVGMDCIRDSNMKNAAVTDILGYWVDQEGQRFLRTLGKRNLTAGITYTLEGSEEDLSLELIGTSTELMPAQIRQGQAKILDTLRKASKPLTAQEIASETHLNPRHTQRILLKLFEVGEIKRQKLESPHGGRPKYAYYSGELPASMPPKPEEGRQPPSWDELLGL